MKHPKPAQQPHPHIETVRRLHALCNAVRSTGTRGSKARIEFVQLAYRYGLVEEITSYALWDRGYVDLGERTFDTCFEMGDSEEVISALIQDARQHGYLGYIEQEINCPKTLARWCSYADRQGELAL
ncbi:hypothetical protein [Azotobacter vinelandii]